MEYLTKSSVTLPYYFDADVDYLTCLKHCSATRQHRPPKKFIFSLES